MKVPLFCAAAAVGLCTGASATPATVAPTDDSFVYKFLPTFNLNSGQFGTILSSAGDADHATRSYLRFDLTGKSIAAGEKATLNLYVRDGQGLGFPFINPSPAFSAPTDVYAAAAVAWGEGTLTFGNQPGFSGGPVASKNIDGVGQYVSFDITALAQSWISNPATNFGVGVDQSVTVTAPGGKVATVYDSSSAANKPFLEILPVPEPVSAGLLAVALIAIRRRRSV